MSTPTATGRSPVYAASLIGLSAAFLLCGYEFIRSTANTLFKEPPPIGYGVAALPYAMVGASCGILLMVYAYSWLLTRLGPRRTLLATSLLSGAAIAACYFAIESGCRPARAALYIVRESYVVLLIEQYWSFLNSRLGSGGARKFNGPICGLGSLGAIVGDLCVAKYSHTFGTATMLLFGAAAIIPATLCSDLAFVICGEPAAKPEDKAHERDYLALGLFKSNRLLTLLLIIIVLTQVIATALDLSFQGQLQQAIPTRDDQNAYSGEFWSHVNMAAAAGQFVITPLLLRFAPITLIHIAIPLANLSLCLYVAGRPSLASASLANLVFKTMDYSIFRAAKEMLYIPFSYDVRYRAKEVIDVWGYRFSKGGTAFGVSMLNSAGASLGDAAYALIACGGAALWLLLVAPVCKYYQERSRTETSSES